MDAETLMTGQDNTDSGDETQTTDTGTTTEETQTGDEQDTETKEVEEGTEESEEEEKEEPRAPEEYEDFTLPEGFEPDETMAAEFKTFAKEIDLTQEQAQKLVEYQAKATAKVQDEFRTFYEDRDKQWFEELKNDKDVGGEKFQENTARVQRAFTTIDPEGTLRKEMATFGLDKWPAMYKAMLKFTDLVGEDTMTGGDKKPAKKDQSLGDIMGWKTF